MHDNSPRRLYLCGKQRGAGHTLRRHFHTFLMSSTIFARKFNLIYYTKHNKYVCSRPVIVFTAKQHHCDRKSNTPSVFTCHLANWTQGRLGGTEVSWWLLVNRPPQTFTFLINN